MVPQILLSVADELLPLQVGLEELGAHGPLHVPLHPPDDVRVVRLIR
jgi:hypothetical protein